MVNRQFHKYVEAHSFKDTDEFFKINSLIGEIGELSNILKKKVFYKRFEEKNAKTNKEIFKSLNDLKHYDENFFEYITDELGDIMFYLYQLMNELNVSADWVMDTQIAKLREQSRKLNRTFIK